MARKLKLERNEGTHEDWETIMPVEAKEDVLLEKDLDKAAGGCRKNDGGS